MARAIAGVGITLLLAACGGQAAGSAVPSPTEAATSTTAPTPSPSPMPTPEPEPGSVADCTLELVLTGAIELTFPTAMEAQIGYRGEPQAFGISGGMLPGDYVALTLPDGQTVDAGWGVTMVDRDGEGPMGIQLIVQVVGQPVFTTPDPAASPTSSLDVVMSGGGRPSFTINLSWSEDPPPGGSPAPLPGTAAFAGRAAGAFDADLAVQSRSGDAAFTSLPAGPVHGIGIIDCDG